MTPETKPHLAPIPTNPVYPKVELPLRLRDGAPCGAVGCPGASRPAARAVPAAREASAQYNVDVVVYFGTSRPSEEPCSTRRSASSNGLVVRSQRRRTESDGLHVPSTTRQPLAIIDRTYVCTTTHARRDLRVEDPSALRAFGAARGGRSFRLHGVEQWGVGGAADRASDTRRGQLARLDHRRAPSTATTVDARREVLPGARRRDARGEQLDVPAVELRRSRSARPACAAALSTAAVVALDCAAPRRLLVRFRATR